MASRRAEGPQTRSEGGTTKNALVRYFTIIKVNIIDRYIGWQVLLASFFAVVILSVVLVLGNIFKELLSQLVDRPDISIGFVIRFMLYVLPFSLSLTIPWGFLTAILLVFGRLSADNELVTLRMAGLSMARICASVMVLAVSFSMLCFWLNMSVSPVMKQKIKEMLPNMIFNLARENPAGLFSDHQVMTDIPRHMVYAEKTEDGLTNFQMIKLDSSKHLEIFVTAKKVELSSELESGVPRMVLEMEDAYFELKANSDAKNFAEIQPYLAEHAPMSIGLDSLRKNNKKVKPETLKYGELMETLKREDLSRGQRSSLKTEVSLRFSFSLACVTLALIAIPLGITAQRRETSIGFAMSLLVGITYFLLMTIAEMMRAKEHLFPHLLVWLPNLIFLGLGYFLFRRMSAK
ncbi:MAG: YjgP/YjgQ family permease [Verrucomicrobia bacterium]|nr:YjgP/YjgQ family permease [Verrucomicrobiota bacterium]